MIERNLGNAERIVRLILGVALAVWLVQQPSYTLADVVAGLVALFLVLNGIFSRCYLWYVLDLNTADRSEAGRRCA